MYIDIYLFCAMLSKWEVPCGYDIVFPDIYGLSFVYRNLVLIYQCENVKLGTAIARLHL